MMRPSYKEALKYLEIEFGRWSVIPDTMIKTSDMMHVNNIMQRMFPGDYKVIFQFDLTSRRFVFKLVFNDPSQETLFLLKYE
jgi:hypothetical protein